MKNFTGCFTAIITPFKKNGDFDEKNFEKIIEYQIKNNIDGLIILGTTGESPTISPEEHDYIIESATKIVNKRTKVIAGTGSNSTQEAIERSKHAEKAGVDGLLLVSPYYNKPTQKGLYEHFAAIANSVEIPIILYNIQGRCGINIETQTLLELAKIKNIVGVKEASHDLNQIFEVINNVPKDFVVLSGNDDQNFAITKMGGDGAISVLSNILPAETKKIVDLSLEKNFDQAQKEHDKLLPLALSCFVETNPQPIKTLMANFEFCEEIFRLPMTTMMPENRKKLLDIWRNIQIG